MSESRTRILRRRMCVWPLERSLPFDWALIFVLFAGIGSTGHAMNGTWDKRDSLLPGRNSIAEDSTCRSVFSFSIGPQVAQRTPRPAFHDAQQVVELVGPQPDTRIGLQGFDPTGQQRAFESGGPCRDQYPVGTGGPAALI